MRPPRISFAGGVYHVVIRCNNREYGFKGNDDFALYLRILLEAKNKYPVKIYAYCLTHNKRHGRTGHFWGERFFSTVIETSSQFFKTVAYIELNMLRNKAVDSPEKWRWSSYNAHAYGHEDQVLDFHKMYLDLGQTPQERQQTYREMIADHIIFGLCF